MSIHTRKLFHVNTRKGGFASAPGYDHWNRLMALSKRELAEVAIRLACQAAGQADTPGTGHKRLWDEITALKANGF